MKTKMIHWTARMIVILAILFVSMFALDSFSPELTIWQQLLGFAIHLVPSFILIIVLLIAWKWELIGGIILMIISLGLSPLIYQHNYNMNHSVGMSLGIIMMITFPFFLAGVLFILEHFMKKKVSGRQSKTDQALIWIFIPVLFLLGSCSSWVVPNKYTGEWQSSNSVITVRTSPKFMKFNFTTDSADVAVKINADKTVTGHIGAAKIVSGKIQRNCGAGIDYIIKCGTIGRIYDTDPLGRKKVELWLLIMKRNDSLEAELRYTENMSAFPMAGIMFTKVKN